jgi:predicted alpha-1,2-mannosidase
MRIIFGTILILLVGSCQPKPPISYVDPFICTQGDHGHWLPAALVPFGLVELCPDTWPGSMTGDGDYAHSGYDYSDDHIRGFSHFHRGSSGGTTIHDRAGILSVVPFNGMPCDTFFCNPVSTVDKISEKAEAGFYSVYLPDDSILAELTATIHSGFHRYTFSGSKGNRLFIYQGNRSGSTGISCIQTDKYTLEGSVGDKYFLIRFNSPLSKIKSWSRTVPENLISALDQQSDGFICEFDDTGDSILLIKVGVSLTSKEAAGKNLDTECYHWDFDKIRNDASESWNSLLSSIEVKGKNINDKTIFYTALYHTCFLPVIQSDADGIYYGPDKQLHKAKGYIHYGGYAFWDSFRTKYPLYSLFIPRIYSEIITSLRDLYLQADNWGSLPGSDHPPHGVIFKAIGKDGYEMFASCRHEHMLMVIADAYFKGLIKSDIREFYPFMFREVMLQMPEKYDSIDYIPARPDQTGEYCWDNWVLAQVARTIDYDESYQYLMKRSDYWKNMWDSTLRFFRARAADGTWLDFPEDPSVNREKYTYEGSKWHWRWNILHDVPSLIDAFGGEKKFVKELECFFEEDLYTAGNQIDLQSPFLFNMAGAPWLTQKWVRKILTEPIVQKYGTHGFFAEPVFDRVYKALPDGYLEEMDDDYGCMAAWYNMSAMGLYQLCPGNPVYQLTAPVFKKVIINLDRSVYPGNRFTIEANDLSKKNIYIQSATLNGKPFSRSSITHEEIVKGGKLVFRMGDKPNMKWGT